MRVWFLALLTKALIISGCVSVWVEKMPLPDGRDWYAYYGQVGQPIRGYMVTSDRFVYDPKTNKLERLQSDVWISSGFGMGSLKSLPVIPTLPVY